RRGPQAAPAATPRAPRGGLGRRPLGRRGEEGEEAGLVEHLDAELAGAGELAAGVLAGDDVVGLLRDGAGDAAAGGLDARLRLVAGERGERAGEHEGLPGQRPRAAHAPLAARPGDAVGAEALHLLPV